MKYKFLIFEVERDGCYGDVETVEIEAATLDLAFSAVRFPFGFSGNFAVITKAYVGDVVIWEGHKNVRRLR